MTSSSKQVRSLEYARSDVDACEHGTRLTSRESPSPHSIRDQSDLGVQCIARISRCPHSIPLAR